MEGKGRRAPPPGSDLAPHAQSHTAPLEFVWGTHPRSNLPKRASANPCRDVPPADSDFAMARLVSVCAHHVHRPRDQAAHHAPSSAHATTSFNSNTRSPTHVSTHPPSPPPTPPPSPLPAANHLSPRTSTHTPTQWHPSSINRAPNSPNTKLPSLRNTSSRPDLCPSSRPPCARTTRCSSRAATTASCWRVLRRSIVTAIWSWRM